MIIRISVYCYIKFQSIIITYSECVGFFSIHSSFPLTMLFRAMLFDVFLICFYSRGNFRNSLGADGFDFTIDSGLYLGFFLFLLFYSVHSKAFDISSAILHNHQTHSATGHSLVRVLRSLNSTLHR